MGGLTYKLNIKPKVRNAIATSIYSKPNEGFEGYDDTTKKVMKFHNESVTTILEEILDKVKKGEDVVKVIEQHIINHDDKLSESTS